MEAADNNEEHLIGERYSLWLVPSVSEERQFIEVIDYLGERFPGPRFAPHVTLLSSLRGQEDDLSEKATDLANNLRSFNVSATGLAMEPYYFRNFYLKLESSANFLLAYQRANQTFSRSTASEFNPHISLHYGTSLREEKNNMGEQIHGQLPGNITFDKLYLVQITLAVPNWRIIRRYDLRGPE